MCCFALAPTCSCISRAPVGSPVFAKKWDARTGLLRWSGQRSRKLPGEPRTSRTDVFRFSGARTRYFPKIKVVSWLTTWIVGFRSFCRTPKRDTKKGGADTLTRLVAAVRDCDAVWSEFSPKIIRGWYIYFWNIALMLLRSLFGV